MRQVLFTIPILKDTFPPDGIPVYGFGAMLFLAFVVAFAWGYSGRVRRAGMEPVRFHDFLIWLFISGIVGARVLYMIQYANQFPDKSVVGILGAFFKIWEGGIVFYGSVVGGVVGYGLFYWFVMRRLKVSGWQLADAVAPLLALGLAVGRIGCYLNGCCWGQVANEQVCSVPLGSAHFPLLPAHARPQLVGEQSLQTTTGFAIQPRTHGGDPRAVVTAVEKGSPAEKAGVRVGDRVVGVNGGPNALVVHLTGPDDKVNAAVEALRAAGGRVVPWQADGPRIEFGARVEFDDPEQYLKNHDSVAGVHYATTDRLDTVTRDWPRGHARLSLKLLHADGSQQDVSFAPVTIGLYPTQLYETVSMVLLIFLLLAYYPYRRHDGQLMVVVMIGYAVHRFINESLRIEPSYTGGLTLSQWGSVVVLAAAVGIEIYLWRVMPSRWKGEQPPAETTPPAPPAPAPTAPAAG